MELDSQTKGCSHDHFGPRDDVHAAGPAGSRRWGGFGSAGRRIARRRCPSEPAPVGPPRHGRRVGGGGPMWDEPPFYRAFDAVLDNEGDAVFLVNGGDRELIRYDIGSGRTSRIGRRGSGPGEFGRPVWLEPHGPDSLLAYDMSLGRFSVFSRSGDFGFVPPGSSSKSCTDTAPPSSPAVSPSTAAVLSCHSLNTSSTTARCSTACTSSRFHTDRADCARPFLYRLHSTDCSPNLQPDLPCPGRIATRPLALLQT